MEAESHATPSIIFYVKSEDFSWIPSEVFVSLYFGFPIGWCCFCSIDFGKLVYLPSLLWINLYRIFLVQIVFLLVTFWTQLTNNITTLGSETSGGSVNILNLRESYICVKLVYLDPYCELIFIVVQDVPCANCIFACDILNTLT